MSDQDDIITGIEAELRASSECEEFVVDWAEREGDVWKVFLRLADASGRLDESLEGAKAWWANPSPGNADVLSVVPEEEQLNLRFVTSQLPTAGGKIRVYPPRYLERLLTLWRDDDFATRSLRWWYEFSKSRRNTFVAPEANGFPWLRPAQRKAFHLLTWDASFLWGPPGTGKTTTLGAILASFVQQFPAARVLLLSTTNTAVDQALIAVDKALESLTRQQGQHSALRKSCLRIGNHFIAKNYEGREHLLPVKDQSLVQRLLELEKVRPDEADVTTYARWKAAIESVRKQIRKQTKDALAGARIAAMTTTRAIFNYEELSGQPAYDVVVFDEASQVGLAHALALVNLGKRVLFGGDPHQLAPVVQSDNVDALRWLGKSAFVAMEQGAGAPYTCFLDEQSRMAKPICHVVSNAFYDGKLKVCARKMEDPGWNREREPIHIRDLGRKHAYLIRTEHESKRSPKYGGVIRYETAELIRDLVENLTTIVRQEDILVITPYRAQRLLIKTFLKNANLRKVTVSTVHRAQGSERDTVIFDPVEAANSFLNNNELGRRLMNVAISRAKARLILIASSENIQNPVLRQIANLIDGRERPRSGVSLHTLVIRPDFPNCAIGKIVQVENTQNRVVCVGRVTGFERGKITIADFDSGMDRSFSVEAIKNM